MKVKVIMDNGREYISEKDKSVAELLERSLGNGNAFSINYISLDLEEKIFINTSHIASVELVDATEEVTYDESDSLVY